MSYQNAGETGTPELVSETIGAMLVSNWDKNNTQGEEPKIFYDQEKPHAIAATELEDYIKVEEGGNAKFNPDESELDDSQGAFEEDVIITVNTYKQIQGSLIEEEIRRILRLKRPRNGSTILKKDGTSVSKITRYDYPLPTFQRTGVGQNTERPSFKSQMLLTVVSQKQWVEP